jgi:uncharacterized membrane protein YgcG
MTSKAFRANWAVLMVLTTVGAGACTQSWLPDTEDQLAPLTEEEQSKIDQDNAAQNAVISQTQQELEDIQSSLENLYPIAAVDSKLSDTAVLAIFGEADPAVAQDQGRKTSSTYISVEQALRHVAANGGGGSSNSSSSSSSASSSSSGSASGGGTPGVAGDVTVDPGQANDSTASFDTATDVQEAINALHWASNIKVNQTNTSFAGSSTDTVQEVLEVLDDLTTFPALGNGVNPASSSSDEYPVVASSTNMTQAINALRFYEAPQLFGFVAGHALPHGYLNEAIYELDRRAYDIETLIQNSGSSGAFVNAAGVVYGTTACGSQPCQPAFTESLRRGDSGYNLPLDSNTVQGAINELRLVIDNYRYADNVRLDFALAALGSTRWSPTSTIQGGDYAMSASTPNYLDALLGKIDQELTYLQAAVSESSGSSSGGGSSGGGTGDAFSITYDGSGAAGRIAPAFSATTTVGQALDSLRSGTNILFDASALGAAWPASSDSVQEAIVSAYTLNHDAIIRLPSDATFLNGLATQISMNGSAVNLAMVDVINNQAGGITDAEDVTIDTVVNPPTAASSVADVLSSVIATQSGQATQIDNIVNATDSTFIAAVRSALLADATFMEQLATNNTFVTQLVTNQTLVTTIQNEGGGGGAEILGLSTSSTPGNMQKTDAVGVVHTGLRAAGEYCRQTSFDGQTYAGAHMCTTSEVVAGLPNASTALLDTLDDGVLSAGFWVWKGTDLAVSVERIAVAGRTGDHRLANCHDFLYGTQDLADGIKGWVEKDYTVANSPLAKLGYSPVCTQGANCGNTRRVLCCK